jgi:amino acid adenylation domain-containing protein
MPHTFVENSNLEAEAISVRPLPSLAELHGERLPHFTSKSFPRLFEEQVVIRPEITAIVCETEQLSFGELNARANQLARHMQICGVGRESIVSICLDRSVEMAVAIIATLKAGAAYLPLDAEYPRDRLAFMLADARPALLLTKTGLNIEAPQETKGIMLDRDWAAIARNSAANLAVTHGKDDLAYVIYTSGSTGQPKGVMITHGNLANYLLALNHELAIDENDLYLHTASIAFSSSRRQLLLPLSRGAGVVIATSDQRKDPIALFQMIKARRVTVMDAVPSFWSNCTTILKSLSADDRRELLANHLRLMLSASEPLLSDLPRAWMNEFAHPAHHVHMFGQTETAGIVALYHVPQNLQSNAYVPVGNPIANTDIYVLDENQQPCAIGVSGELYIGGAGVGRGYLNQPKLTCENFISLDGARLYRTGDWARVSATGQIEFAGRRDQQVKLRGFRVELGEIEATLLRHPSIKECAVTARDDHHDGDRKLVGYYVPQDQVATVRDLREFLSARLPDYSVPSTFVRMQALPLSANGKVDRLALPAPDDSRRELSSEYLAPRTPLETRLVEIWAKVLKIDDIGVNDNFFELGGHSLRAAQIVARLRNEVKIEVSLRVLFECPTPAAMANDIQSQIESSQKTSAPALCAAKRGNEAPLSFAQQRLWFLDQLEPGSSSYNICRAIQIRGRLDLDKLRQSLEAIVMRHEILRTTFASHDGRAVQVIHPNARSPFALIDLTECPATEFRAEVERLATHEQQASFDLTEGPLLRTKLLRLDDEKSLLLLTIHHIISDGWSIGLFLSELAAFYCAVQNDQAVDLPPLPIQYADYALWQRRCLNDDSLKEQLDYWKQQLQNSPPALDLATDYPRPAAQSFRGAQQSVLLSRELSDAVQTISQREGVTPFMTLLAAFQTLLFRYSGQDDIVVGSPTAGRAMVQTENLIGLFVNTLVLRSDLSGNPSFRELLGRVREVALGAYANQDVPFERLVEELQPERSLDRTSLFQVMFTLQNTPTPVLRENGLNLTPVRLGKTTAKFDLALEMSDEGGQLRASLEYRTDLFTATTTARMLGHFQTLLEAAAFNPAESIANTPLLTKDERQQVLLEWNETHAEFPAESCVHQLFEDQAEKAPASIAAVFEDQQLTYGELNSRANQLARYLRKQGLGPDVLVGICVERSLGMLVGLLGILKAGGAYVPLDPSFPKERLGFMIADADVRILLTEQKLVSDLPPHHAQVVCLDSDREIIARESAENPVDAATSDNLAYVIYTSGSTGRPKGVQISHRALTNFLCSVQREPGLTSDDILLSVTTLSFDIAGLELYLPLIGGARLVIASREVSIDAIRLQEKFVETGATIMQATPATWKMLIDAGWQGNERLKILCGGEALSRELARQLLERCGQLWNMYGPTETTIWSTMCRVESPDVLISIGRPLANTEMYLLDQNLNPVPVGVAGELHIGGEGLARGYLNRPELTSEKFIRNPFSSDPGSRIYKTGDLARYLPDGKIECLGRVDDQVKIRGFRIELGEIESVLRRHESVRECVVVAREDVPAGKLLVAYVVAACEAKIDSNELRAFMQTELPDYMTPAVMVELPELPLTPNGKVNRRALPAPDYDAQTQAGYVAPRTLIEELLAGIWAEVLKVSRVGVNDNFFELGGHSLLATQVVSRVLQTFGKQLPLAALFEGPTIAGMAERIEAARKDTTALEVLPLTRSSRDGAVLPLSFGQQSFWILDNLTPNTSLYSISRAVRLRGRLNLSALQNALDSLIARHELLRTIFSTVDGEPVQVVVEDQKLILTEIDLEQLSPVTRELELRKLLEDESQRPFDLAHGPLLRATLFRLNAEEHVLILTMHHIVVDDWSLGLLSRELQDLYDSFVMSRPPQLAELPVQYADFALWEQALLQNGTLDRQMEYWTSQLSGAPALLELPTDRPRTSAPTHRGARHTLTVSPELRDQLGKLSRREGVTLFMTLLAAFQTLLARHSGQDDIVVGSPIAGRNRVETENLIGSFINTLVLRTSLSGNPTFSGLLQRVRDVALGAYAHQETPFGKLVEVLQPERSLSHSPLFQVMFVFQNAPTFDLNLNGLSVSREQMNKQGSPLDLMLEARETSEGIRCFFEYKTDLFDPATIERLAERFQLLLKAVVDDPTQRVEDLPLLGDTERQRMLVEWNGNRIDYPQATCVHQLFEAQAVKTPEAPAVEFSGRRLTYDELNARANQFAHYLIKHGVCPGAMVGISIERSFDMVIAILGVLKTGAAYVPLDPTYPRERIAFMIKDTASRVVITQSHLAANIDADAQLIRIDDDWQVISAENKYSPNVPVSSAEIALVLYTSGSTGNPKGVMLEHRSLVNFATTAQASYEIKAADRVLQFGSLSFDLSVEEMLLALTSGACLVLRTAEIISSPEDFLTRCEEWKLSVLDLPTVYWHELTDALTKRNLRLPACIRLVIIGGEKASSDRVAAWKKVVGAKVRLLNTYGPTETTIAVTVCDLNTYPSDAIKNISPIGRPFPNAEAYILDSKLRPVPIGVAGELHIGGPGVARGYLNRADLTSQKFVANPFSEDSDARLYKTGDLVRYHADGNIEFLGRSDNQIKIRGFRVELEEIERAISSHECVENCLVIATDGDDKRLVAYVITRDNSREAIGDIRNHLKAKLPSYMVPAAFEVIADFPLNSSGKINRRALPEPQFNLLSTDTALDLPTTPIEETLLAAWREILKVDQIGIHENFFDLGGHSLLAARLVSIVRNTLNVEMNMVDVFEAPTIRGMAEILYPRIAQIDSDSELAKLVEELAGLSDLEAQLRLERELGPQESIA